MHEQISLLQNVIRKGTKTQMQPSHLIRYESITELEKTAQLTDRYKHNIDQVVSLCGPEQEQEMLQFDQLLETDKKKNNHFVDAAGVNWSNLLDQSDSESLNMQAFTERTTSAKFDFNF
jgi:hypothetical protein